jgi:hypothetical protein
MEYQDAAALAACTFVIHASFSGAVTVLLPSNEKPSALLTHSAKELGFIIETFPFKPNHKQSFTSQLKCHAYAWQIPKLGRKEIILLADADTCCLKRIELPLDVAREILRGRVALVPDIVDRHPQDPSLPWYLAPLERSVYVNSGVIFASVRARGFFESVRKFSNEPRFLTGPFEDQTLINFSLGRHYPSLLLPLDRRFNTIGPVCEQTEIAHFAGGAGLLARQERKNHHQQMCLSVLNARGHPAPASLQNPFSSPST